MAEWRTVAVIGCETEAGETVSVIEQRQAKAMAEFNAEPVSRYVLGNGQEVLRLHGSSFFNLQTGEEYMRQVIYPKMDPQAA